jgi:hypothetical protein
MPVKGGAREKMKGAEMSKTLRFQKPEEVHE